VFFSISGAVPTARSAVDAGSLTALVAAGLIAIGFVLGFALPRRARAGAHG
jgi:hypothetical protein